MILNSLALYSNLNNSVSLNSIQSFIEYFRDLESRQNHQTQINRHTNGSTKYETDHSRHSNNHTNNSKGKHDKSNSKYYVKTIYRDEVDPKEPRHLDIDSHADGYEQWYYGHQRHHNTTGPHRDWKDHVAHRNRHSQAHTNEPAHNNYSHVRTGHSNHPYSKHSNIVHSDTGFNHVNYIPSTPNINIKAGQKIRDIFKLLVYSYDGNKNERGTIADSGRDRVANGNIVDLDFTLRRIRDLKGNSISNEYKSWSVKNANDGGTEININTLDPFNLGYRDKHTSEGIYVLTVQASNPEYHYNGDMRPIANSSTRTITFTIQQNEDPNVVVENGDEFIGVIFGKNRIFRNNSEYTSSGRLYEDIENNNGAYLRLHLTDADINDTHKGTARIIDSSGNPISEFFEITFGEFLKTSHYVRREATVFIPKSAFAELDREIADQCKVEITIKDYTPDGNEAGARIVQTTTGGSSNTAMTIDVDNIAPTINIALRKPTETTWKQIEQYRVSIVDRSIGIKSIRSVIERKNLQTNSFEVYRVQEVNESQIGTSRWNDSTRHLADIITGTLDEYGIYRITVETEDKAGNRTVTKLQEDVLKVSPMDIHLRLIPDYPMTIPASETVQVRAEIESDVDLENSGTIRFIDSGLSSNIPFIRKTEEGKYLFEGEITIPERYVDKEYPMIFDIKRFDGGETNHKTGRIKVVTPINLTFVEVGSYSPGAIHDYVVKTTKYVESVTINMKNGEIGDRTEQMKKVVKTTESGGIYFEWIYTLNTDLNWKQDINLKFTATTYNGNIETKTAVSEMVPVEFGKMEVLHSDLRKDAYEGHNKLIQDNKKKGTIWTGEFLPGESMFPMFTALSGIRPKVEYIEIVATKEGSELSRVVYGSRGGIGIDAPIMNINGIEVPLWKWSDTKTKGRYTFTFGDTNTAYPTKTGSIDISDYSKYGILWNKDTMLNLGARNEEEVDVKVIIKFKNIQQELTGTAKAKYKLIKNIESISPGF